MDTKLIDTVCNWRHHTNRNRQMLSAKGTAFKPPRRWRWSHKVGVRVEGRVERLTKDCRLEFQFNNQSDEGMHSYRCSHRCHLPLITGTCHVPSGCITCILYIFESQQQQSLSLPFPMFNIYRSLPFLIKHAISQSR